MSKDIIVLTPNGRRQKIHCTPDTSILQVLEDVCQKQGFQPSEYDLKHHNHLLDLTTTVRFSNLPNKATLEMVETERRREESNVTIGLLLEDGERRTADFPPNTSLYELITTLASSELSSLQHPMILYMRQEVTGLAALRDKTLRQLGLIGGRAILRLLNKAEDGKQANVSAVYRRSTIEKNDVANVKGMDPTQIAFHTNENSAPGPSDIRKDDQKNFDPITIIKNEKYKPETHLNTDIKENMSIDENNQNIVLKKETHVAVDPTLIAKKNGADTKASMSQENLERRLRIEEEVTFVGAQKAVVFMQPDGIVDEFDDLPDEFYELTIEEVRKLYHDLQQHRLQLENTPLITTSKREDVASQSSQQKLNTYKNVVVRIQFPDHIILQGIFSPSNTIGDVTNFVKEHLQNPDEQFHIFTTPLKEILDSKMTLLEAKFVPCVHMHFKGLEDVKQPYLKQEIYSKKTTSDAASILASKYRAPSRKKAENPSDSNQRSIRTAPSTSKDSKVPKWYKN